MKKRLWGLLLALVLAFSCSAAETDHTEFADVLLAVDYGEDITYVIGHKSPDADTIGSGRHVFTPKASRKSKIVPPLTEALEKWTEAGRQNPPDDAE